VIAVIDRGGGLVEVGHDHGVGVCADVGIQVQSRPAVGSPVTINQTAMR